MGKGWVLGVLALGVGFLLAARKGTSTPRDEFIAAGIDYMVAQGVNKDMAQRAVYAAAYVEEQCGNSEASRAAAGVLGEELVAAGGSRAAEMAALRKYVLGTQAYCPSALAHLDETL